MTMFNDHSGGTPTLPQADATVRLADYTPPAYFIDNIALTFDLDPIKTRVLNKMTVRRNLDAPMQALRLDGQDLDLARVLINGSAASFKIDGEQLVLENLPHGEDHQNAPFEVEIFTTCYPAKNTQLMGLYVSQDTFFTQCEAEGFRRITYFPDRPDVMSSFAVTLRADKAIYPVLLSNGNLVDEGDLEDGRHFATWVDPHKKPSYLFALVAGNLVCREQRIKAMNGRDHLLQIYVRSGDLDKTDHAMQSLMHSIAWDEARFGLPLDLDRFMIVATSDFNMGAMENKGLNIFNTKLLLANAHTATDVDFANIESVVGHEYFHNWTGNRVTCRDWFQLSLKEGLTVFRDQEFSMDLCPDAASRAVKRIEDVRQLRSLQFAEDAGPMAHPVRPSSYQEISNFYTMTVYEKGAEVVRMMQTLVGKEGFAKGMTLYFERHDGQAVTCDDFAAAIADANPHSPLAAHLDQFKHWYTQAGTPRLRVRWDHDSAAQTLTLHFAQNCPDTPDQKGGDKKPFVIPVRLGLLDAHTGQEITLPNDLIVLTERETTLTLANINAPVVPSILRGFSAPVLVEQDLSDAELCTLLAHDTDPFYRWEAGQQLLQRQIIAHVQKTTADIAPTADVLDASTVQALQSVLQDPLLDAAFKDLVLTAPAEGYIAEQMAAAGLGLNPVRIHHSRQRLRLQLAKALHADWLRIAEQPASTGAYSPNPVDAGKRALRNLALSFIALHAKTTGDTVWPGKLYHRVKTATNMTERFGALQALVHAGLDLAQPALEHFYNQFAHEALVIDKWFAVQATQPEWIAQQNHNVLGKVRKLLQHSAFTLANPNRARSLVFGLCSSNPGAFHRLDAGGYVLWADCVLQLDGSNAQVAARLARALDGWRKLDSPYKEAARQAIERVAAKPSLSKDVREVVSRALAD